MSVTVESRALKFWQGVNQALTEEMERDEKTFLIGEDVARVGGPYGVTRGLLDKFGPSRVRDTPISEPLLVGLGTGAAAVGMRPIVEIMFFDFAMLAMDQIVNQAAKYRYFTGHSLPLTIRTMCGVGGPNGAQHSQNFEAWFGAVPGLKVVMPSNAADAKGLLKSAIRDDDPTLFIETQGLLTARHETPLDPDLLIPLGEASVPREGTDVTLVAIGRQVDRALEAAEQLDAEGISVEVVDPRTLAPLDRPAIVDSIRRTGRLVVAQDATSPFSFASEVLALAVEDCLGELKTKPRRVTSPFINVPTPVPLAEARTPGVDDIVTALRECAGEGIEMRHEIKVADADPGEEVEVVQLNVEVGAAVKAGDALMEIASDKANMDLTSPVDGTVAELNVKEFEVVPADHLFGIVSDD